MDDRVAHLAQLAIRRAQRGGAEPAAAAAAVVAAILRRVEAVKSAREDGREKVGERGGGWARPGVDRALSVLSRRVDGSAGVDEAGSRDRRGAACRAARRGSRATHPVSVAFAAPVIAAHFGEA